MPREYLVRLTFIRLSTQSIIKADSRLVKKMMPQDTPFGAPGPERLAPTFEKFTCFSKSEYKGKATATFSSNIGQTD